MIKKKILIATGGTGGHIYPAYSLANYLLKKNYVVKLTSDKRGLSFLKNIQNLNFINIPSSPIVKKNLFKFLFSIIIILYATIKSFIFLTINRPVIVFGMGGYSSFPVCIAAFFLNIKFVIYENNLIIGKANKYLLPFAKKIFVSYQSLEGIPEKYKRKVVSIGNLIRENIIKKNLSFDEKDKFNNLKILVLGGSQGAKVFAEDLPPIFEKIKNLKLSIKVYQQCQKNQNCQLTEFYEKAKIEHEIFNFKENIIDYYLKTNLVITRSGASVLGELINIKIPFISIPLPTSADNHQYKNAEFYYKRGYGFLLEEKDIKNKLFDLIKNIFEEKDLIRNILSNQRQYSDKDIYKNLNTQIKKIIDEKN
jgi:UDP-N-acetylglucosamine--N-acetylmuramyl-(pentapeptide) pyrophosphoryl-undecaprenol N-acetylglucosamine transferase